MTEGFSMYAYESKMLINDVLRLVDLYEPIDPVTRFFEDGEEQNNTAKTNDTLISKIKSAFAAVKKMITDAISKFTTWIQTMFMDKNEKDRFQQFKETMKDNPEFANKKITVKNFRAIEDAHKQALAEVDKSLQAMTNATDEKAAQIEENCKNKVNSILQGIASTGKTIVSKQTALRLCESNRVFAKILNAMLQKENSVVQGLERELGDERAADFKKKVKSCSRRLSLHRLKVMITGQYHKTTSGAINQVLQDMSDVTSFKPTKVVKRLDIVDDAIGSYNTKSGSDINKRDIASGAMDVAMGVRKFKKSSEKTIKSARNLANFFTT